ncbi:MAG TPA: acyl-CoA dehydrogenase [Mycobacteriales bacterium]|nr:acyl-CoA dehydrogenase [Mycobacteriales bacterium]
MRADIEAAFGAVDDPSAVVSGARSTGWDAAEEFPASACAALDRIGVPRTYVPARYGGDLGDYAGLLDAVRTIAARDLTVAVAHAKTFLGGACVWVAGRPEQARELAAEIFAGAPVSWALTEPGHGSDLLAGEFTAAPGPHGFILDGTKWPINNATRSDLLCVLARTGAEGGPRAFSLFLVDKRRIGADGFSTLPKVPTHGIRGADISGLTLTGAEVRNDAMVGPEGSGLETVLKTLQLTRIVCVALSLGAADHALSLAAEFTAGRELYGSRLAELPHVRRSRGRSYARLFAAEAVAFVAARAIHTLTPELSVISAVAKAYVPEQIDMLVGDCGELLGARAFMAGVFADGRFQKLERDHRIVGIFDGNTFVNRNALINQFPILGRAYRAGTADAAAVVAAATVDSAGAEPDFGRLSLAARSGCSIVQHLPHAVAGLNAPDGARESAAELLAECDALHARLTEYRPTGADPAPEAFELARRYESCFAGAAAIALWNANDRTGDPLWEDALWLRAVLRHVLGDLGRSGSDEVFDELPGRVSSAASIVRTARQEVAV